jgi:hypothetical protein
MRRGAAILAMVMLLGACTGSPEPQGTGRTTALVDLQGRVLDGPTGEPVVGATLAGSGQPVLTGEYGSFSLAGVALGTLITVESCSHEPASFEVGATDDLLVLQLQPLEIEGTVLSNITGEGVKATIHTEPPVGTDGKGRFTLIGICPGDEVTVSAKGYSKSQAISAGEGETEVELAAGPDTTFSQVVAWEAERRFKDVCSAAHPDTRAYLSVAQCVAGYRTESAAGVQAVSVKITSVNYVKWTFPQCALHDFGPRTYATTAAMSFTYRVTVPSGGVVSTKGTAHWSLVKKDGTWRWFPLWRCETPLP